MVYFKGILRLPENEEIIRREVSQLLFDLFIGKLLILSISFFDYDGFSRLAVYCGSIINLTNSISIVISTIITNFNLKRLTKNYLI